MANRWGNSRNSGWLYCFQFPLMHPILIIIGILLTHIFLSFILAFLIQICHITGGFPGGSVSKESICNEGEAGVTGSILGLERSLGGEHGNPLQYSLVENPMDRGAWPLGSQSQTWLNWLSTHKTNVMHLNHPETVSPDLSPVCGKIIFHETGPWCRKGRRLLL